MAALDMLTIFGAGLVLGMLIALSGNGNKNGSQTVITVYDTVEVITQEQAQLIEEYNRTVTDTAYRAWITSPELRVGVKHLLGYE